MENNNQEPQQNDDMVVLEPIKSLENNEFLYYIISDDESAPCREKFNTHTNRFTSVIGLLAEKKNWCMR